MASTSTRPVATADKLILTPFLTLEGHGPWNTSYGDDIQYECKFISHISYFQKGKEIEKDREGFEDVQAVGVSRDGRWVVIAGGKGIKVSEVETGIVRTFYEGRWFNCIDICADSTLLAGASYRQVWIWTLDTGELMAGPFVIGLEIPIALRFSEDSHKLAESSYDLKECHLRVWDVDSQKLEVQKSAHRVVVGSNFPIFWTTKDKSIVTAFGSPIDETTMIYEYDASTLKTNGAPFKHTPPIYRLALSCDCRFLASASGRSHCTIKLWAFESRQLLASFNVETVVTFVLSPDSRQLAYTNLDDAKIRICDIPANILAHIESTSKSDLLNSDATRRTVRRKPVTIPVTSPIPRPLPTNDPHAFPRFLRKLLPFSSRTNAVHTEPRNLLDFPATSPLPRPFIRPDENTNHELPPTVNVPLAPGKLRIATAGAPGDDDDLIRDEEYVPPPSPTPNSRPGIADAGQHGSGRFCFCF